MKNKRVWTRLLTEGKGNFLTRDRDIFGVMSLNNYSRSGLRASLDKSVEPGSDVLVEVNLPRYNMPIWATGKVVWTKMKDEKVSDQFEAGIELNEIDLFNIKQVRDECYKDKYLEQVADYAYEVGLHTRKNKSGFFKTSYSKAALFIIFFLAGSLFTLVSSLFAFLYSLTLTAYLVNILIKRRKIIFDTKVSLNSLFSKKAFLRMAGIILNNICSGIYYILGYASGIKTGLQKS